MRGLVLHKKSSNTLWVELPINDDTLSLGFKEKFNENDFVFISDCECICVEVDTIDDEVHLPLEVVNKIATTILDLELTDYFVRAYITEFGVQKLNEISEYTFYSSKYDFLNDLYSFYGLNNFDFLGTTVDQFLNGDYIFEEILSHGKARLCFNGVIITLGKGV